MVHIDVIRMWCQHHQNVLQSYERLYGSQPTAETAYRGWNIIGGGGVFESACTAAAISEKNSAGYLFIFAANVTINIGVCWRLHC